MGCCCVGPMGICQECHHSSGCSPVQWSDGAVVRWGSGLGCLGSGGSVLGEDRVA
jgi:hypothetical protein